MGHKGIEGHLAESAVAFGRSTRFAFLATLCAFAAFVLFLTSTAAQAAPPVTIAEKGTRAGQVENPFSVAVRQSTGDLYVADRSNFRIDKFDSAGNFLLAFGFGVADGHSLELQACGPAASPPTVKCFEGEGANTARASGAVAPYSLAIEQSTGNIFAADGGNRRISVFGPSGEFLLAFGGGVASGGAEGSGDIEAGSTIVRSVTFAKKKFVEGQIITASGGGIPAGTEISGIRTSTSAGTPNSIELSKPATETATGVTLTAAADPGNVPTNEKQLLTLGAGVKSGNFKLTFTLPLASTQTTANIPYNASAVQVQSALEALSGIGAGNVAVSSPNPGGEAGKPGGPYTVEFTGARYADTDVAQLKRADGAPNLNTVEGTTLETTHQGTVAAEICTSDCVQGAVGSGSGEFTAPLSLAFDPEGKLWVGDTGRLQRFEPDGSFASEIALPSAVNTKGLAIDSAGDFYAIRQSLPGVRKLEAGTGNLLEVIDEAGGPQALTLDSSGNLYVGGTPVPYHFKIFNPSGEQVSQFGAGQVIGSPGAGNGVPANALAVDETSGRLYVASSREDDSAVQAFTVPEPGPLPELPAVEDLLPTTATLTAQLNPEDNPTTYHFEYGTTTAYGTQTPTKALPGADYETEAVSAAVDHLLPETEYHFRLVASNHCNPSEPLEVCTTESEDATFTTPSAVGINSQWATGVAAHSATFRALIDPLGPPAEWWLEYGTSEAYGSKTESQGLAAGIGEVAVAQTIAGLKAGTTYHYRFAATDERDGVTYLVHGPDRQITTQLSGLGFELVDNRAWEQVSPLAKGGGTVIAPYQAIQKASAGGDAFTYATLGPIAETEGNRVLETSQSLARRTASGWVSTDINPPNEIAQPVHFGDGFMQFPLFSEDLSLAALQPWGQKAVSDGLLSEEASERTPYLRENFAEPVRYRPLVSGKEGYANVEPGIEFGGEREGQLPFVFSPVEVAGASPDLAHLVLRAKVPLGAEAEGVHSESAFLSQANLYKWSEGDLELVSRTPAAEGDKAVLGWLGSARISTRRAVSADGRYVYWSFGGEISPTALYLRDTEAGETVRLDVVQPGATGKGVDAPIFQGASADGTRAFFTDTRQLVAGASEGGRDLYACDVVHEAGALKCVLSDLTPEAGDQFANVQAATGISEDGDSVYFVANGALAAGASPGNCSLEPKPGETCSLYLTRHDGSAWSTRFIATFAGEDGPSWGATAYEGSTARLFASISPSGRYLAFMSQRSLTDYDNRDAASGEANEEVYRYDSVADELACVSCNPSGARPRGGVVPDGGGSAVNPGSLPAWRDRWVAALLPMPRHDGFLPAYYEPRSMLDNGRVVFNAYDALVPADSNGTADAYLYEPHGIGDCTPSAGGAGVSQALEGGGCVALLSSGTSEREAVAFDASASGDDVFFMSAAKLSALDEDPDYDIYDARVDGVAAVREVHAECQGEACQPPYTPPSDPTPASAAFEGAGNVREEAATTRRCPQGKRKVKRKGKVRCVKPHRKNKNRRANPTRRAAR